MNLCYNVLKGGKIIKRRKVDYELVKKEFDERGYILLSKEYIKNSFQLEYLCPKHLDRGVQHITFGNFTAGKGCPYCGGTKRKTHEEYVKQLKEKKPNIRVIGKYKSLKTRIEHECLICEYRWFALPDNLLNLKNGCPNCKKSKGESKISEILDKYNINYIQQYRNNTCKSIYSLPFDFYLPEHNTLVEYDGKQHFEPCTFGGISKEEAKKNFESCIKRDKIKTNFYKENNINLIRIPYFDYDKIEEIIVSIIH